MDLIIRVKEIKGNCPVYHPGDCFKLMDGYRLVTEIPLCMHSLSSILPYYNALKFCSPDQLGLSSEPDRSRVYVQCLDPCSYTGGGTVIFEISRSSQPSGGRSR